MRAQKALAQLIAQYDRRRARAILPMVSRLVKENGRDHVILVDENQQTPEITAQQAREYIFSLAAKHGVTMNPFEETKAPEKP